jgi:hypothetical protein
VGAGRPGAGTIGTTAGPPGRCVVGLGDAVAVGLGEVGFVGGVVGGFVVGGFVGSFVGNFVNGGFVSGGTFVIGGFWGGAVRPGCPGPGVAGCCGGPGGSVSWAFGAGARARVVPASGRTSAPAEETLAANVTAAATPAAANKRVVFMIMMILLPYRRCSGSGQYHGFLVRAGESSQLR